MKKKFKSTKCSVAVTLNGKRTKMKLWVVFNRNNYQNWSETALGKEFTKQWEIREKREKRKFER